MCFVSLFLQRSGRQAGKGCRIEGVDDTLPSLASFVSLSQLLFHLGFATSCIDIAL